MISAGRVRPVHKGAWNAETEYSMLDIVITAGRTAAYIARQDVPAGIGLTNPEYWGLLVEVESILEDYTELNERVDQLSEVIASKASAIFSSVTGDGAVVITDSAASPLRGLNLYGKTTQGGTPTPGASIPLVNVGACGSIMVGANGKNLLRNTLNNQTQNGITFVKNDDGSITVTGTATNNVYYHMDFTGKTLVPGQVYTMSIENSGGVYCFAGYFKGDSFDTLAVVNSDVPVMKFTTPYTYTGNRFYLRVDQGTTVNTTLRVQIESGSVATAYEPYKDGGSVTVSTSSGLSGVPVVSDGNYTDSTGQQWFCDEIDFARGVYIKNVPTVDVSTLTYTATNTAGVFVANLHYPAVNTEYGADPSAVFMCDTLPVLPRNQVAEGKAQGITPSRGYVYLCIDGITTTTELMEWLAEHPTKIMYRPETPLAEETALSSEEVAAFQTLYTNCPNTTLYNNAAAGMRLDYIADTEAYIKFAHSADMMRYVHMPRILFTGPTNGMSKDNAVVLAFEYRGAENYINNPTGYGKREDGVIHKGYAKVKWQGTSSIAFPKKNYTVTLYTDVTCTVKLPLTLRTAWGAQSKYCMKANFIDPSQCRNVVAAKLWAKSVLSRPVDSVSYKAMHALPNAGAIDGYPVLTFINGEYVGLYTLNIPKDEWMFGMKDGEGMNVVLLGENWLPATAFTGESAIDGTDWDYEVEPADKTWVKESFNKIYKAVAMDDSTTDAIAAKKAAIEACVDVYSVIDYGIFVNKLCLTDNTGKNLLMVTYDGVHWIMSAYDMDTAFGMHWSGAGYFDTSGDTRNNLVEVVKTLYADVYATRKAVLDEVLSKKVICHEIDKFIIDVPEEAFALEAKLWPDMCGANANNISQIKTFVILRDN